MEGKQGIQNPSDDVRSFDTGCVDEAVSNQWLGKELMTIDEVTVTK